MGVVLSQTSQPWNFFHEIVKITTFTKILPLEKYPLYCIPFYIHVASFPDSLPHAQTWKQEERKRGRVWNILSHKWRQVERLYNYIHVHGWTQPRHAIMPTLFATCPTGASRIFVPIDFAYEKDLFVVQDRTRGLQPSLSAASLSVHKLVEGPRPVHSEYSCTWHAHSCSAWLVVYMHL